MSKEIRKTRYMRTKWCELMPGNKRLMPFMRNVLQGMCLNLSVEIRLFSSFLSLSDVLTLIHTFLSVVPSLY